MLLANATTNWFFDRTIIKNSLSNTEPKYQQMKIVHKNPPALDIYSNNYEIEDVWRVGKTIKDYNENNNDNLPNNFIFFGEVPENLMENYSLLKKEIYIKDDGHMAELNYLEKFK